MSTGTSISKRILLILLSTIFLIGPGAGFMYVAYLAYIDNGFFAVIIPSLLGLIFLGGGIAGVVANLKNNNR